MLIDNFMNPHRKNESVDRWVWSGTLINDIDLKDINTNKAYVGVRSLNGEMIGAIQTERLAYVLSHNRDFWFAQILDHLDIGVIAVDADSRIFYVNSAYSHILNIFPGKIIGRYMNVIEKDAALLHVLETRQSEKREKQLIKSVNKYVSVNMFPLYQRGEFKGACSLFTDITELDHLTNEMNRISQVAEEYKQQIQVDEYLKNHHIIGKSDAYVNCIRKAMMVAKTDATVLIRGENGTGKEVISKIIQENSERSGKPFIKVNCAAIPEALMESEFFGYEEGSFTGAKKGGRAGKFQLADGGTIFLDEIGDIPLPMQAKLLRVLQEGEIEKIGGQKTIPVNVRVVAATNQPLEKMIEAGTFRIDLYYRLNVVAIDIPSLKERGNDIVLIADEFLREFNKKYMQKKVFAKDAYKALLSYSWPGNVRELRNTVESSVVLSAGDMITANDFPRMIFDKSQNTSIVTEKQSFSSTVICLDEEDESLGLEEKIKIYEKKLIQKTLEKCDGNRNQAMETLKLSRRTFYRKLSEYDLKK